MKGTLKTPRGAPRLEVVSPLDSRSADVLTSEALEFIARLERRFRAQRAACLENRLERQAAFDSGELPGFLDETADVRSAEWKVAPVPADLQDRRVEITGPVDRKMVINGLNSCAKVFMADFEDATSPTWSNVLSGQVNLRDAVAGTIEFTSPEGKRYALSERTATLMVRPRGWHLVEKNVLVDEQPVSASLFDFGLFLFHNALPLISRGSGPYFYLPKLESHVEARLWNDVFEFAQDELDLAHGTIKATVLIETISAAFEMDEILHELREHSAGLNCGRWDYIFSFIKKFHRRPDFVLPDRARVTMQTHFLRSYSQLLIRTCHRRGAHAMGGMAAQIPIKNDPEANEVACQKVVEDKMREVADGHDGTWVAHPGLIPLAMKVFDEHMPGPNQIHVSRDDVEVEAADLLAVPDGEITEGGLRTNLRVGVEYLAAWLGGRGCVPLNDLMEDAATAEICRAQLWQWIHHPGGVLGDGRKITVTLVKDVLREELRGMREAVGEEVFSSGRFAVAAELFEKLVTSEEFAEFLTLPAYELL